MNRNVKTAIQIFGIVAIIMICAAIMYFGLAKTLSTGYLSASKTTHSTWLIKYNSLLLYITAFTLFTSMLWYVLARFIFTISSCYNVGKRLLWAIILGVNLLGVVLLTHFTGPAEKGVSLYLIHLVLFGLVGHYLGSVLFTPAAYKYTPVGANLLKIMKK